MAIIDDINQLVPGDWVALIAILSKLATGEAPASEQPPPPQET